MRKQILPNKGHALRLELPLSGFTFVFALSLLVACDSKTSTSATAEGRLQSKSTAAETVTGTWHDEDQLLLIGATEESQEVVVGYDLVPKTVVLERGEEGQRIYGWMVLRNKRVISDTSYSLEASCETHEGEKASLKLTSAITFEADKSLFQVTEEEKSVYQKLGEFDCVASIPGDTTRKYQLTPDLEYLSLFEENSSEALIKLKRGK